MDFILRPWRREDVDDVMRCGVCKRGQIFDYCMYALLAVDV